jgi:hypothetical protein
MRKFKRILSAVLTFGLSEIIGKPCCPTDGVARVDDTDELKRTMNEGRVVFTKLK